MKKFFKVVDFASEIVAWLGIVLIAALAVMYTIDVLGRLIFSSQIKGTFEIAQFMLCLMSFAAYGFAQTKRSHIHVGFIVHLLPQKGRLIQSAFSFLWGIAICGLITYALWNQGAYTFASNKLTQVLELPYYPIYYASSVLMGMFTLTLIADIIRCIMAIAGDEAMTQSIEKVYS